MTPCYLLDTNVCIAYKKRKSGIPERIETLPAGQVAMSVVTWGELMLGVEKSQFRERSLEILKRVREIIPVIGTDESVGDHYGAIRGQLELAGKKIGPNDLWIAAHARALGIPVVTNNTGEFARVSGLTVEDWTQA
ncbi:MAG: type II toxin-antitoxin system VapC family toxin [Betaproteobacteria bacterium]|jgi:tRNA(fMet)-specific endonuclease VapC|nr:type II toxin-antitoxin system VapC family toxin [Betaproteobacteria bacterium]MBK9782757.1 type II toxin-antitoxin system VapC family toxin [Candidatus Dechloromonas phosphorivorans]